MPKAAAKKVVKKGKYISSNWQRLIKPTASPERGDAGLRPHVDGTASRLLPAENGLDWMVTMVVQKIFD